MSATGISISKAVALLRSEATALISRLDEIEQYITELTNDGVPVATVNFARKINRRASRMPDEAAAKEIDRKVMTALERETRRSTRPVQRTGRDELWQCKRPELVGVPRNQVRAAISRLLQKGVIRKTDKGLQFGAETGR